MSLQKAKEETIIEPKWYLIPIVMAVYVIALYLIQPFAAEGLGSYVISSNNLILAALGGLAFLIVAHRFGWLGAKPGQISMTISMGLFFWAFAETTWMTYELVGESPFPSIADIFYIAGYFMFAIALLLNNRTIRMKFSSQLLGLWIALSIVAFVLIAYLAVVPILESVIGLETVVALVYPFADFIIIVLALVMLLKFRSGEIAKPWALLILGFVLQAIGDIWFAYAENTGTYSAAYHPADLILSLGYAIILASGLFFVHTYKVHGGRGSA